MKVTAIQNIRKVTVTATTTPRQYKVVVSSTPKQRIITFATLGKQGFKGDKGEDADLTVLGNYERDWSQDFLIALNT